MTCRPPKLARSVRVRAVVWSVIRRLVLRQVSASNMRHRDRFCLGLGGNLERTKKLSSRIILPLGHSKQQRRRATHLRVSPCPNIMQLLCRANGTLLSGQSPAQTVNRTNARFWRVLASLLGLPPGQSWLAQGPERCTWLAGMFAPLVAKTLFELPNWVAMTGMIGWAVLGYIFAPYGM